MLFYLSRATQVMGLVIHAPHPYLDNVGTLHTSLDEAQRASGIALMREARTNNVGFICWFPLRTDPVREGISTEI